MISDAENTTNWTSYTGTLTISTQSVVTTAPPDLNYKEPGSYVIQATGTADSSGNFQIVYTFTATNLSGDASNEFLSGWLKYFSLWVKPSQTGTFQVKLVDNIGKTAWWNIAATLNTNIYYHNLIGTYTGNDSGFDITNITAVRVGYTGMAANAAATFSVDGLRVQGDPTFDTIYWTTTPIDDLMQKESPTGVIPNAIIGIGPPKTYPSRRRGYATKSAEEGELISIGVTPVYVITKPMRLGYQFIAEQISNKSEGKMRFYRDNAYRELRRIILRNPTGFPGINYMFYKAHAQDDNYVSRPPRAKGYIDCEAIIYKNTHG